MKPEFMVTNESNGTGIKNLTSLVDQLQLIKDKLADLEKETKRLVELREELSKKTIPDYMLELGIGDSIKLANGLSVEVEPFYYANLPPASNDKPEAIARREAGLAWLRDNGHGGLIKEIIVVQPDLENAQLIIDFLQYVHAGYEEKSSVHASTLKSWFRKVTESGVEVPANIFSAYVGRIAKVR